MIKKIAQEQTLPLRSLVLRKGMPLEKCILPTDEVPGIFHLGYFKGDQLICIATFFPEDTQDKGTGGFRLRGMATDPAFAGKGFGAELIKFAINELTSAQASYIWCNARTTAVGFYHKLGFEVISEEFEVSGIGPHFDMYRQLKK